MKKVKGLILGLSFCLFSSVNASTLTFDDIPGGSVQNTYADVGTYEGFAFSSNLDWIDVVDSTWNFGAVSGDFALLNNNSGIGTITEQSGADFTFDGLWAKSWATGPESGGVDSLLGTLSGYNNGSLVWSVATSLNGSYEFYAAQLGLIDELRLGFGNYFLVDNLSLNGVSGVSNVPLPAALFMFAPALLGFMGFRRRFKA